ncbi:MULTISPECIES: hypothetical protein [Stenotrophomonas]|nr:hypothetical protein [Stenotrophomonas maltophilia]
MKLYLMFLPLSLTIFFMAETVTDTNQIEVQSGPSPKFLEQMKRELPRLRLQTKQAFEESLIVSDYAEKHPENLLCASASLDSKRLAREAAADYFLASAYFEGAADRLAKLRHGFANSQRSIDVSRTCRGANSPDNYFTTGRK